MLWWGWLAFNAGSTFGVSGRKWILASLSVITTLVSSFSGCIFAVFYRYVISFHMCLLDKKKSYFL